MYTTAYRKRALCECVSGILPDGGGIQLADENCDICNGSGFPGRTIEDVEAEVEAYESDEDSCCPDYAGAYSRRRR